MDNASKVVNNSSIVFIGNLVFRLISLVITIYLARYLGVDDFGKYNFVLAFIALFGILTDVGLNDILVREISRDGSKANILIGNILHTKIYLSIFAIVTSVTLAYLLDYSMEYLIYILVASISLLFQSLSDIFRILFQCRFLMKYDVISKLSSKLLLTLLTFFLIIADSSLFYLILAFVLSELLRMLVNYFYFRRMIVLDKTINLSLILGLLRKSLPIAISGVFLIIHHRIDVLMLSIIDGDFSVGIYSAAYKLSEPFGIVPNAILVSLYPLMSISFSKSPNTVIQTYEKGMKYIFLLMMPIFVSIYFLSEELIFFVYGNEFSLSIPALKILTLAIVFSALNYLLIMFLTSINMQKVSAFAMGCGVLINVSLNFLLIPTYSYNGASVATVLTEAILFIIFYLYISARFGKIDLIGISLRPLSASLIMAIFLYFCSILDVNIFFSSLFSALIYVVILYLNGTFSSAEIELFKTILPNLMDRRKGTE